ncbi:sorbosone dehydrogenase family protein [Streptomyces sp. NBRC 109706]|uniref:PQQ-dependent sugar dehydrogenase n=1 Tax=Streptomyces sp. NBRC 109706 TaxID=1550035 RepID=UPI001F1B8B6F|nr:PQQ-dependent sugar dehydrogenase [Streptomyces sp. NBRC 109706]
MLVFIAACTTEPPATPASPATTRTPPSTPPSSLEDSVVVEGLDAPWSVAFRDDTALISERDTARILEVEGDTTREVGVIDDVVPAGEGGLLGIAVHDTYLYAYFTGAGKNRIDRYELTGEPGALALGESETVLDGLPAASYHNGGRIAFGPDGMLYATVGDAGDQSSAQDLDSLSGKILRLTPNGGIPADNPFDGSLVYSYGHRNPQGIAWDEEGTLYASEFGQDTWDELNVIEPGGNYGWPVVEGIAGQDGFSDPVQQWPPADASPSGIAVVGDVIAVANLRGERLREVPLDDLAVSTEKLVHEYGRLRDVVVARDGALWVITNNTDGRGDPTEGDDRIIRVPATDPP